MELENVRIPFAQAIRENKLGVRDPYHVVRLHRPELLLRGILIRFGRVYLIDVDAWWTWLRDRSVREAEERYGTDAAS